MHLYGAFFIASRFFLPRSVCREFLMSAHGDWSEEVFLDWEESMPLLPETTPLV